MGHQQELPFPLHEDHAGDAAGDTTAHSAWSVPPLDAGDNATERALLLANVSVSPMARALQLEPYN